MVALGRPLVTAVPLGVQHLQAGYGHRVLLEDISFALGAGEWFVLLGPNGCGKSTLLDCVTGRKVPTAGEIDIAGYSLERSSVDAKMQLGYGVAPDALPLLLTARQCLEIHAGAKRLPVIDPDVLQLADELRLTPYCWRWSAIRN